MKFERCRATIRFTWFLLVFIVDGRVRVSKSRDYLIKPLMTRSLTVP